MATEKAAKEKFKKGHRRAHSMPLAVHKLERGITDDQLDDDDEAPKVTVNYNVRYQHEEAPGPSSRRNPVRFDVDEIEIIEDEDDFSVSMDEEEIMRMPGMGADETNDYPIYRRHRRFWQLNWKRVHFAGLPSWLQDNEFLHSGHRPPMPSFLSCFKSIFSLHTETGNIFTHMYGCMAFIGITCWFLSRPSTEIAWLDKLIFTTFFIGAILCMGMSFAFHTVSCHSDEVYRIFSKLDYAGISLLIVGSFVPWLHYGFYCRMLPKFIYTGMIIVLGIAAFIVSMWDKFAEPEVRHWRAIIFIAMGLSSIAPNVHLLITDGIIWMFNEASLHWLILMGVLYILGAVIYALRIPERFFPGKCDIWIFHLFVVGAALVHFYGLVKIAEQRLEGSSCSEQLTESGGTDEPLFYWLDKHFRPY